MSVDEAHLLAGWTRDESGLLLNVRMDSQATAAIVLVGHTELCRTLRLSIREAFWQTQRMSVRCQLRALGLPETGAYIRHQVECG